ncbi:hypothetical protein C1H46_034221 [Malus baccata]|uniref:Uncharacterized protein n=1 Tax=Malus baccata TaxID=106549 RepID=A0A540L1A9_MALBA|nr:hypothetical protein C1H46_034221 [Malus baccata]
MSNERIKFTKVTHRSQKGAQHARHRVDNADPLPYAVAVLNKSARGDEEGDLNFNVEGLDHNMITYIDEAFTRWYIEWKSGLHNHFLAFPNMETIIVTACPKELAQRLEDWKPFFQDPKFFWYSIIDNSFTVTARSKLSITIMTMFNMLWNLLEGLRIWIVVIDGYGSERRLLGNRREFDDRSLGPEVAAYGPGQMNHILCALQLSDITFQIPSPPDSQPSQLANFQPSQPADFQPPHLW